MADIFLSWKDVVGPHYARFTLPTRLQALPEGQFTLHVQVSREQALEVRYDAPKLIARLNQYFGGERIHTLSLHLVEDVVIPTEEDSAPSEEQRSSEQAVPSLETLLARLQAHLRDNKK
jgi:hypothetical protein